MRWPSVRVGSAVAEAGARSPSRGRGGAYGPARGRACDVMVRWGWFPGGCAWRWRVCGLFPDAVRMVWRSTCTWEWRTSSERAQVFRMIPGFVDVRQDGLSCSRVRAGGLCTWEHVNLLVIAMQEPRGSGKKSVLCHCGPALPCAALRPAPDRRPRSCDASARRAAHSRKTCPLVIRRYRRGLGSRRQWADALPTLRQSASPTSEPD